MSDEVPQMIPYIEKLIELSRSNQFAWTKASPTVFVHSDQLGRITLQRIPVPPSRPMPNAGLLATPPIEAAYVLQGHELPRSGQIGPPAGQVLSLDGRTYPAVNRLLDTLYKAIDQGMANRGLDFLKAMVDGKA